ncbi:MAG: hypothetical protein D6696_21430, partial [Acidobacteria bacterium]
FFSLAPGLYTVSVDPATLPATITGPTFDFDGVATPNTAVAPPIAKANPFVDSIDFGYAGDLGATDGVIGDRLWLDFDGDGIQGPLEPGIPGVTVILRDASLSVIASQVTAADGIYNFTGLAGGTYLVEVSSATLPAGLVQTFDLDGTLDNFHALAITGEEVRDDVDFGYRGQGSIGDRVWQDDDGDGTDNGGTEPGIANVVVDLFDGLGVHVASRATDATGAYLFPGLPADAYDVVIDATTLPAGVTQTFDRDGVLDDRTSVVLAAAQNVLDADFGYQPAPVADSAIGDRLWLDGDGDGIQDPTESGIDGATVTLLDAGGVALASTVSGPDGAYGFANLAAGTYTVEVDPTTLPPGLAPTFDFDGIATPDRATLALADGETNNLVDFGYGPCGACEGKVSSLTLQYNGTASGINVVIDAKRGGKKKIEEVFSGVLDPGDLITVDGPLSGNPGFFGTLGTEIRIFIDGALHTVIHTSCSQPIGPGLVSGDFLVVSGASKNGGLLCPLGGGSGTCQASAALPAVAGNVLSWTITNDGTGVLTLVEGGFSWPASNGDLTAVRLGGVTIFAGSRPPTQTTIVETDWQGLLGDRQIPVGSSAALELEFANPAVADPDLYALSASFDGGCAVDHSAVTGNEGCTPGYWMQSQHFDSWVGHGQADDFNATFGVTASGNPTLLEALETGGGKFKALNRHAVAALLNTTNPGVSYAFTGAEVLSIVQTAYATGDWASAKDQLEAENERGCPLN